MRGVAAAIVMAVLSAAGAVAQYGQASPLTPSVVQDQSERDRTQERLDSESQKSVKLAPTHEQIMRDAAGLAKAAGLSCEVTNAALINQGTATINGKPTHVKTYETACANGLGYFLVEQPPEPSFGFTCFAADAVHAADVAAGRDPQPACVLPANADTKKAAATVLSRLGQTCAVTNLRVIGTDTKTKAELTEAACTGGTGFVISSPLPGASVTLSALSCPDSYRRGVTCKLSSNGAPLVTLDTFKQVLAQHKVACTAENIRVIGRQNASKRHVVEFKCPEQPNGLVAFIPLEDATGPFEVMDCPAAGAKARIICTLTQIH